MNATITNTITNTPGSRQSASFCRLLFAGGLAFIMMWLLAVMVLPASASATQVPAQDAAAHAAIAQSSHAAEADAIGHGQHNDHSHASDDCDSGSCAEVAPVESSSFAEPRINKTYLLAPTPVCQFSSHPLLRPPRTNA